MFTTAELTVTQLHGFGFLAMCQFATSLHHVASYQDNCVTTAEPNGDNADQNMCS